MHPLTYLKHRKLFVFAALLILCCRGQAQTRKYEAGSDFEFGFARILTNKNSTGQRTQNIQHYIDQEGHIAFDSILRGGFLAKTKWEFPDDTTLLPEHYYVVVEKKKKLGVLTSDGHWLLRPLYDTIDTRNPMGWIVKKDGHQSIFTKNGLAVPLKFEQVWQMDSNYYNVVQQGKWGVYSKKDSTLVIPCLYEDMDYCYSCPDKGDYVFAKIKGRWGIVDIHNKIRVPFQYDHRHINMTSGNMVYALYHNNTQLKINLTTGKVDSCQCAPNDNGDTIDLEGGFKLVEQNNLYGLVNAAGKNILDYKYSQILYESDSAWINVPAPYVQIRNEHGWGIADTTGKLLVPPIYDHISMVSNDSLLICTRKIGGIYQDVLINLHIGQILPDHYDAIKAAATDHQIDSPVVHFLQLEKNNLFGLYNPATKVLIPPNFDEIKHYQFSTQFPHAVVVKKNGLSGILDVTTGKWIIKPKFNSIETEKLPAGLAIVAQNGQFGLYNYLSKTMIIPLKNIVLYKTENNKALLVKAGLKYGLQDFKGDKITDSSYDEIHSLNDSLYVLMSRDAQFNNHYRFYNSQSKDYYTAPGDTLEGVYVDTMAILVKNAHYFLWNPATRQIIHGPYDKNGAPTFIDVFTRGLAIFYNGHKKAGVLTTNGNLIAPAIYDGLTRFKNGYSLILKGKNKRGVFQYGFLDSTGRTVIPASYDLDQNRQVSDYFMDSCFVLLLQDSLGHYLTGLANQNGRQIIQPLYSKIIAQQQGQYYIVKKNNLFGIIDRLGNTILPVVFSDIGLSSWPVYEQQYGFHFPIFAKKGGAWHYYLKDGSMLPIVVARHIQFNEAIF
jgi:hypothetical protein